MQKFKLNKQNQRINKKLLVYSLLLTAIGITAVADASAPSAIVNFSDKYYFAKQQLMWAVIGIISMLIASRINYKYISRFAIYIFAACLILLIIVLIPGVGTKTLGARRWLNLGYFSIQPSEIAKLAIVIYIAKVAQSNKKILSYIIPIGLVSLLVVIQPDLGTTVVIAAASLVQIFISGISIIKMFAIVSAGFLASLLLILTSDYRRARLMTYFEISNDPLGQSYHIRQVLISLGAGGLFGMGFGQSRQKFLFLPEAATDSIFAVIAEETGFVGASILLIIFYVFISEGMKIVKNSPDVFSKVLSAGIVSWLSFQTILNIGAMTATLPLTGIPLPFISYGGSALVMNLVAVGILLNISRYEKRGS